MSAALAGLPQTTKPAQPTVLVLDDDRAMCELAEAQLTARGHVVNWSQSPEEALELLESNDYWAMVVDLHMEGQNGLDVCRAALAKRPTLPVIVMTGFGTMEHAVGAIRAGAYDFVTKPLSMDAFTLAVERALQHRSMTEELGRLRQRLEVEQLPSVIGGGGAMTQVASMIERVATSDTSVLITGESGTGKELVARALHAKSGRTGPFLAINCAAVPETLLESELFGHERGAFTDARSSRNGLFVEANGGTLFLDEIGEMPPGMQAKLLRALQERKVRRIGGTQEVAFDARLVTATNRDLEAEVSAKRFREDLFYRVNVVRVDVPPLRRRGTDILELAQFFLDRAARRAGKPVEHLDRAVAQQLLTYDWPGNVRELENCMERAVALSRFDRITLDDLPTKIREGRNDVTFEEENTTLRTMDEVETLYIKRVIQAVNNNKTLAAKVLGFDRRTLYRKLQDMS
jgi:two-component system response regulator HydG